MISWQFRPRYNNTSVYSVLDVGWLSIFDKVAFHCTNNKNTSKVVFLNDLVDLLDETNK